MVQNKAKWILVLNFFLLSIFWKSTFGDYSTLERNCWKSEQYCPSGCIVAQEINNFQKFVENSIPFLFNRTDQRSCALKEPWKRHRLAHEARQILEFQECLSNTIKVQEALLETAYMVEETASMQMESARQLENDIEDLETSFLGMERDLRDAEVRCILPSLEETDTSSGVLTETNAPCSDRDCEQQDLMHPVSSCNLQSHAIKDDCAAFNRAGYKQSGVYILSGGTNSTPFKAYCDMDTDGGGWTVVQRRTNGSLDFDRDWLDYKQGFGDTRDYCTGEFWLGNEQLTRLTENQFQTVRFEMTDWDDQKRVAQYLYFRVHPESNLYRMQISIYDCEVSDAPDSLSGRTYPDAQRRNHNNMYFTTRDRDNDRLTTGNCAQPHRQESLRDFQPGSFLRPSGPGGWWYNECHAANLNGKYYSGGYYGYDASTAGIDGNGIIWTAWMGTRYSFKKTEIKLRPPDFRRS